MSFGTAILYAGVKTHRASSPRERSTILRVHRVRTDGVRLRQAPQKALQPAQPLVGMLEGVRDSWIWPSLSLPLGM